MHSHYVIDSIFYCNSRFFCNYNPLKTMTAFAAQKTLESKNKTIYNGGIA